ncbi:MAG: YccF domain-containing protein [Actinobacteria bacterium]|nr:YccF domain-containing protein [Actinomycetota bacterium]
MRFLGNIVWLLFGGIFMALGYVVAGLIMCLLIVTIPFGLQAFKLAAFTLFPFTSALVRRPEAGTGSVVGNVLWFILAGWWLALGHLVSALILTITIIGIPFAVVHMKLALVSLVPFGKEVIPRDMTAGRSVVVG